ncbi:MAG: PAS domain-containing sensor histidine kinase, partial [Magnetococcales bacterium]|nr:PAS domain-containing sensor histidine kinase [Magnetococcales bacterium]
EGGYETFEEGFRLCIVRSGEAMAALEIKGLAFSEHRDRYLNTVLAIVPVIALAVHNARTMRARVRDSKKISRLNDNLEKRVKELGVLNDELEAFTYAVSHDLQQPLLGIEGFSRHLERQLKEHLSDKHRHYLERIRSGALRMGQLIDDLLKLSRSTRGELKIQDCDLTSHVKNVLDQLHGREPDRSMETEVEADMRIMADPRFLKVVLENLLGNAWKYTAKQPYAKIVCRAISNGFMVEDNGAGFDMAQADRLFRPFQRLHDDSIFKGSGIGLSTVQRIIHRHGGTISGRSSPGEGARFYVVMEPRGER